MMNFAIDSLARQVSDAIRWGDPDILRKVGIEIKKKLAPLKKAVTEGRLSKPWEDDRYFFGALETLQEMIEHTKTRVLPASARKLIEGRKHVGKILTFLHQNPDVSQNNIAEACGIQVTNLSKLLAELEACELINRRSVHREKAVSLTPLGETAVALLRAGALYLAPDVDAHEGEKITFEEQEEGKIEIDFQGEKLPDILMTLAGGKGVALDRIGKIVVVEDKPETLSRIQDVLKDTFEVKEYETGAGTVTAIKKENPDLIILDMSVPEMDGKELLERLRAISSLRDLPVVRLNLSTLDSLLEKKRRVGSE